MPIGQPIGLLPLVDEAVEDVEIVIVVNKSLVHAHVADVECLPVHVHALRKEDAHFVKM